LDLRFFVKAGSQPRPQWWPISQGGEKDVVMMTDVDDDVDEMKDEG
jgi:hypothetical protein